MYRIYYSSKAQLTNMSNAFVSDLLTNYLTRLKERKTGDYNEYQL